MAKLSAPLLSLRASASVGKAITFFTWKGINVARQYVVPANPRSDDQLTQRQNLEDAVTEWHAAAYTAGDKTAWNRFAGTLAKTMSGFNAMVQAWVNEKILANVWYRIMGVSCYYEGANALNIRCESDNAAPLPICYYGVSKTNLANQVTGIWQPSGFFAFSLVGLTADTLYYYTIKRGVSGSNYGRSGIYQQRTAAA